jgi:hypothetical protein
MPNVNFEQLATTTLRLHRPELADNITGKNAAIVQMKQRGFVEEEEGALSYNEPILFDENSTTGSYRDWDPIDLTPQDGMTNAEFLIAQLAGSLMISGRQEFINSGNRTRIINLLTAKTMQLQKSLTLLVNRQSHGDGTGNSGKDLTGFSALVESGVGGLWSVVGGIDSQTDVWWRNQWLAMQATSPSSGIPAGGLDFTSASLLGFRRLVTTMINAAMRNNERTTVILSDQTVHEYMETTITQNERYVKEGSMADATLANAGFVNIFFKNIPWVMDDDMPGFSLVAGSDNHEILGLNNDYLHLKIGKGKNFVVTPFVRPPDKDGKVAQVLFYANYTIANRQRQFRIDDVDFA